MTLARPGARPSMRRRPQKHGNPNSRDSNLVRASVFETALELGITQDSTVAKWIFDGPLEEEDEIEEETPIAPHTPHQSAEEEDTPLTLSQPPSYDSNTASKPPSFLSHLPLPDHPRAPPPTGTVNLPTADHSRRVSHGIHFKDISPELFIPLSSPSLSVRPTTRQQSSGDSIRLSAASRPFDDQSTINSVTPWEVQLTPNRKAESPEVGYTSDGQGLSTTRSFFKSGRSKSKEAKPREPKNKEPKSPAKSKRSSNEGATTDGEMGYLSDGAYISKKPKSKGAMSFFRRKNKAEVVPPLPDFPTLPSFGDPRLRPPQPSSPNLSVDSDPFSRPSPEMPFQAGRPSFPTHSRPGSDDKVVLSSSSTPLPPATPPSTSASLVPPAEPRLRTHSSPTAPSSRISPPAPILVPPNTAGGAPATSSPRGGGGSAMRPRLPPPQMPPPSSPLPQLPPSPMSVQSQLQPSSSSYNGHANARGVTSAPQTALLRPDSALDTHGSRGGARSSGSNSNGMLSPPRSAPPQQTQMRARTLPEPPCAAGQLRAQAAGERPSTSSSSSSRKQQHSAPLDAPYGWSGSPPTSDPPSYAEHDFGVPHVHVRGPPPGAGAGGRGAAAAAGGGAGVPRRESTRTAESSLSRSTSASGSGEGSSGYAASSYRESKSSSVYPESRYTGATSAAYSYRESKASSAAYPESRYTSMLTLDEGGSFDEEGDERGDDYERGQGDSREGGEYEEGDGEEDADDDDASVYPDDNQTAGRRTMYLVENGRDMEDDEFLADEPFPF